jgi:hypothetical protein
LILKQHAAAIRVSFAISIVIVAFGTVPANSQVPTCRPDPMTGIPVPTTAPGACVTTTGSSVFLIQLTDDGLLVLEIDGKYLDLGRPEQDGTSLLHLQDEQVGLIYCLPSLVDPVSAYPTTDCIWDLATMAAGPAAVVGVGRVSGNVAIGPAGAVLCPSSIYAAASVTSPGGDPLDLTSSLVLAPADGASGQSEVQGNTCTAIRGATALSYGEMPGHHDRAWLDGRPAAHGGNRPDSDDLGFDLRRLPELDETEWLMVAELMQLDDSQWILLQRLLSLDSDQLNRLHALLTTDGAAVISDTGEVVGVTQAEPGTSGSVVTIDEVEGLLDTILAKVNSIISKVNSISARLPDRSDIRALLNQLNNIDQISSGLNAVKELLGGVLAVAATLREGFEEWQGNDCGPSSQCAAFKTDLSGLFTDLSDAAVFIQTLACFDRPGLEIRPLNTDLLNELVIQDAPTVVLYGLSKVLERVAPPEPDGTGGWRTTIRDVLGQIPDDVRTDFMTLCEDPVESSPMGSGGAVCTVLRPEETGLALQAAVAVADKNQLVVKLLDKFIKPVLNPVIGAVAAAGGTVGFSVKNPTKIVTESLEDLAEALPDKMRDVVDKRKDCLDADAEIESDLRDCQPPVSVFLEKTRGLPPHPTFADVEAVVAMRIREAQFCRDQLGCTLINVDQARQFMDVSSSLGSTPRGYQYLCCAYRALTGVNSVACLPSQEP